ncbi:MAG: ABC transporter ATP-binding protein, partial [Christensenellales bacterium]
MLRLENITKDFPVGKDQVTNVLKGITVQFRSCEFVSILGHSGCGKTTLLNIVGGLDKSTSGSVFLDGADTADFSDADWNDYRNRQIGFVFQSYNLIPHQTVLRNVEMPLILAEVPEEERKRRALEALEKVGLRDQAKKRPLQMSGGQMQRVAIARAIVNNPSIILADEPTGALDSESGRQVIDLLKEISSERLVIMVTHNDALAD